MFCSLISYCYFSETGLNESYYNSNRNRSNGMSKFDVQALQEDVKTLEPSVSNINNCVLLLSPKVDEELQMELKRTTEQLNSSWIRVVADAKEKNGILKGALDLTRKSIEGIGSTNQWLNELEVEIPAIGVINSTSELSQTLRKLNALKNRVDSKTVEYRSVLDAGIYSFIYLPHIIFVH